MSLLGLSQAMRRMRQALMRAMALSTGRRRRKWARLTDFLPGGEVFAGLLPGGHGHDVTGSQAGLVGRNREPGRIQISAIRRWRAAVRPWIRPANAGEIRI